jgi:hypothetical protein
MKKNSSKKKKKKDLWSVNENPVYRKKEEERIRNSKVSYRVQSLNAERERIFKL